MPLMLAVTVLATPAAAAYPDRPVRLIVPAGPGGPVDSTARTLAQQLSLQTGVAFVVVNKPGASFVLGTMEIVRAAPDGYTIGFGNVVSLAINRTLIPKLPYDVDKDLTLISKCVHSFNLLVVNNAVPVRSVAELIAYAKRHPGKLTVGSSGNGTTGHLSAELFKAMAGVDILHVPYRGSPQALNDLIAGNVDMVFDNIGAASAHVKAGRLRALGVSALTRARSFPDLPTIDEAGVAGFETKTWLGVVGPAGLPPGIVRKLNLEIRNALAVPAVAEGFRDYDAEVDAGTPEQFAQLVRRETPKWAEVIRRSGAKID